MKKKFWQSPNFIMAALSALLALIVGITNSEIAAFVAIVPAALAIWNRYKDGGTLPFLEWIGKANVRNWIATALVIALPSLPSELLDSLWGIFDAILGKNWNALLVLLLNAATIIWKLVRNRVTPSAALFFALMLWLPANSYGQNKREVRAVEKRNQRAIQSGSDIVLSPIEQVPETKPLTLARATQAPVTNWGRDLLAPEIVLNRMRNECKFPVVVKVADTGNKWGHTYLQKGQINGSDYTGEGGADDFNGHSTHCAGIIGGKEVGLLWPLVDAGIVRLKPVKVLRNNGSGSFGFVAQAFRTELADDRALLQSGTSVVWSGSFGGGTSEVSDVEDALKASTAAGVVFVFAAGNSGQEGVGYPGRSQYGIGVGSLDQGLIRSAFSSTGPEVWLAAPGRSINSTYKGNTFALLSGTSMATPFVSALVAIAKSKYGPSFLTTPAQTRAYLAWVCNDIAPTGKDNATGWGMAYVLSVLDKHPKDIPNQPAPPPPAPPANDFPIRALDLVVTGNFPFVYSAIGGGKANTHDLESRFVVNSIGHISPENATTQTLDELVEGVNLRTFTATKFVLVVQGKKDLPTTFADTQTGTQKFFSSRGFQLPAPTDGYEALKWAAFFLEMHLQENAPTKVFATVMEVQGVGPNGEAVTIPYDKLKHWKK